MKALRRSHPSAKSNPSSNPSPNSNNNNTNNNESNNNNNSNEISPSSSTSSSSSWIQLRSVLLIVSSSSSPSSSSSSSSNTSPYKKPSDRGHLKSPWSRRKRKHALTAHQWRNSFGTDGKLRDGGIKLLKKIRSGGVDPSIRAEVWPFLLGVYDMNSTKEERDVIRNKNRNEYEKLRRQCRQMHKHSDDAKQKETSGSASNGSSESPNNKEPTSPPTSEDVVSARESLSSDKGSSDVESENNSSTLISRSNSSPLAPNTTAQSVINSDSSDSESSEDDQFDETSTPFEQDTDLQESPNGDSSPPKMINVNSNVCRSEDFASWQRIIRLDAIRANAEWKSYSPTQASVPEDRAWRCAEEVGLKDYDHLEPCRVHHAARLVAILEAYAIYDSEIGYCQGMSDLLSPMISIIEDDHMAFWCFVGFMKRARHNFRLDEVGIRRQLNIVAKIIKYKDSHLYRHLVQLQAEDCFFVYRMVVVLFRRELNFEQTLCLWEVMWADQAALRAGIGKSAWSRIRQRAPPTEDLLLYAIAASVLQRRKQIIEKYNSMDDILRECNNMAGQLDVWKLLDDAHDLVMTLHEKIESNFSQR